MRLALFLIFVAVPLLEIALLIKTGQWLGFWPTFGLVIFTAILGSFMLRWQGLAVMQRAGEAIRAGRMPLEPVVDGMFLLFAGALLLTPGIATDAVGLALLVPGVRRWIGKRILNAILKSENIDFPTGGDGVGSRPRSNRRDGPIIEADYERVDDDPASGGSKS